MPRLSPRVHFLIQSLGGRRSLHWREAAVDNWTLAPEVIRPNPIPLCINGQIEKAMSLDHGPRVDTKRFLIADTLTHKATTAHLLKDVQLVGTSLFTGRTHHFVSDQRAAFVDRTPAQHIDSAVFASGYSGNRWFGHFLHDTCPMCLMAMDVAEDLHFGLASAPLVTDHIGQRSEYLSLLNINIPTISRAHFNSLVIIDPLGQNDYHRMKLFEMRRRIAHNVQTRTAGGKFYLKRGTHGEARDPLNEEEVVTLLLSQGFSVLEPEKLPLQQLLSTLLGASIVVGMEGSHFVHAMLTAADGANMLMFLPPHRFAANMKITCDEIGLPWSFLIGHERPNRQFVIDTLELQQTLELLGSA